MGEGGTIRVETALVAFYFHAREAVLVDGKARHLDFRQVGFQWDRGKAMRACALFFKGGNIVVGQINDVAQAIDGLLHAVDFLRHDLKLVDRAVKRQGSAVTIVNDAAAGGDWHQLNAVFV